MKKGTGYFSGSIHMKSCPSPVVWSINAEGRVEKRNEMGGKG